MTAQVLGAWEAKCPKVVRWERIRTDVPGTKEVTICRCSACNRTK